ncbi:MAG: DegT/DnrJ/EryC1/StrS family aminotransferase [Vicinamibacterales bacterium]
MRGPRAGKALLRDLAIFGGSPAFAAPLHVGRPNVGDRAALHARIDGLLDRGVFTNMGPLVREFERRVAEFAGTRHCIAMCNATMALMVAIGAWHSPRRSSCPPSRSSPPCTPCSGWG